MKNTADIVIIGAGIIGPSTAYHLAKSGVQSITIVDAFSAGGLATNATAAMLMAQTGVEETTELAKLSIKKYKNFKEELVEDIEFNNCGSLVYTSTEKGKKTLIEQAIMQNRNGVYTEVLNSLAIKKKSKGLLATQDLKLGLYARDDSYINAKLAVNAYISGAKDKGLKIQENNKVKKIIVNNDEVNGVELENGERIYTNTVINCAGVYAGDVASTIGLKIPIKASKKCLGIVKNAQFKNFPIVEDLDEGWYFRPHSEGILVGFGLGEWIEKDNREKSPHFEFQKIEELKEYLKLKAPNLLPVKFISGWAGYRPMIDPQYKDALPIIGPVDGIKGYYNNCGYGEFGITLAPIAGQLISQIVLNQHTSVNVVPFLLSRFNK